MVIAAALTARQAVVRRVDLAVGLAAVALPIVFALVANNHRQVHYWFEYRSLGLGVTALMLMWWARHDADVTIDVRAGSEVESPETDPALA
ncbi:MAG: hypothetical protein AAGA99_15450 [Actinomycetota bacterium]